MHNEKNVICQNFSRFADGLIYLNKHNRSLHSEQYENDKLRWAFSFSTVKIDIGRQVGKTSYIKESYNHETDLIIVQSKHSSGFPYKKNPNERIMNLYTVAEIEDLHLNHNRKFQNGFKFRNIYFDDYTRLEFKIGEFSFFYDLIPFCDEHTTFILLG